MFLLYAFVIAAIALFNSQSHAQTRDLVFQCYSWGDPHVQTWRPKDARQIYNRDCYVNGHHTLVSNRFIDFLVHVHSKLVKEVNLKFYDGQTSHPIFQLHLKDFPKTAGQHSREMNGITVDMTLIGKYTSFVINYPAANIVIAIHENGNCPNSCYYNIYVWQPQSLAEQSTGLCAIEDRGCTIRSAETIDSEWEPVRSGSARQFITEEQAANICNEYVDAFFVQTRQALYQRNAHLNSTVASLLAGCVDDLVLTGQIEMAESILDVLMVEELTRDATSIDAIQTAMLSGSRAASSMLDDAAKLARVATRQTL